MFENDQNNKYKQKTRQNSWQDLKNYYEWLKKKSHHYTVEMLQMHSVEKAGKSAHFFLGLHNRKAFVSCKN